MENRFRGDGPWSNVPRLGADPVSITRDFSQGRGEHTGRSLDVAIHGDGFFVLQSPNGPLYTRNGVFNLTPEGDLVTNDGLRVEGTNGPISLPTDAPLQQLTIFADGTIVNGDREVAQFQSVRFNDPQVLQAIGPSTFAAPSDVVPQPAEVTFEQGEREMANASPTDELVRMIVGLRHHEASQRALRTIAEAVQKHTDPRGA